MKAATRPVRYRCKICKHSMTIARRTDRLRPALHRKYLWCTKCRRITNHEQENDDGT